MTDQVIGPFIIIHIEPFKKSNPFCTCSSNHLIIQKVWQKSNVLTFKTECCTYSTNPSHPLINSFLKNKCKSKNDHPQLTETHSTHFSFIDNDDSTYSIDTPSYFYKIGEFSEWCYRFYEVNDQLVYLLVIFDTQILTKDKICFSQINTYYFKLRNKHQVKSLTSVDLGYQLKYGYSYDYLTSSILPGSPTQLSTYDRLCDHHIINIIHNRIDMDRHIKCIPNRVNLIITYNICIDKWISYLSKYYPTAKIYVDYSFYEFKLVSNKPINHENEDLHFIITTYHNLCDTDFYMKAILKQCNSTSFQSVLNSSEFTNSIWSMTHLFKLCDNQEKKQYEINNLFHLKGKGIDLPFHLLVYDSPTLFITQSLNEYVHGNNMAKTIEKLKWINLIQRDNTVVIDEDKHCHNFSMNYRYPLSILTKKYWCIDKNAISLNNRRIQLFPFHQSNDSVHHKKWYRIDPQIIDALLSSRPDLIHHFNDLSHQHEIHKLKIQTVLIHYTEIEKREMRFYTQPNNEDESETRVKSSPLFFKQKSIFRQPPEPFEKVKNQLLDHWKGIIEDKKNDKETIFLEMEKTKLSLLTCLSSFCGITNNSPPERYGQVTYSHPLNQLIQKGKENEQFITEEIEGYAKQIRELDHEINKMKRILQYIEHLNINITAKHSQSSQSNVFTCAICFEHISDQEENKYLGSAILFRCGHIVCRPCGLIICMDNQVPIRTCPICRVGLSNELILDCPPENFDHICAYPIYFNSLENNNLDFTLSTSSCLNYLLVYARQIYGPRLSKLIEIIYQEQNHNYIILIDQKQHDNEHFFDFIQSFRQLISDNTHNLTSKRESNHRKRKNTNIHSLFDFIDIIYSCIYPTTTLTKCVCHKNNSGISITFIQLNTLYEQHYLQNGLINFMQEDNPNVIKKLFSFILFHENQNSNLIRLIEKTSWIHNHLNKIIQIKNQ